jgi:hypothetical protein
MLTSVLIAEKTLPGTFVKIHITNSKPFKTSDLYDVVYKVIKIKFEQFQDTLNLRSLRYGPIKLILFMEWTHQA